MPKNFKLQRPYNRNRVYGKFKKKYGTDNTDNGNSVNIIQNMSGQA
jgi:hypothetical protein